MTNLESLIAFFIVGLFIVTVLTDIITQVIKKVTYEIIPTNVLCLCIAMVLCILASIIGSCMRIYEFVWYYIVFAIIVGFLDSFICMNGFDKFVQTVQQYKKILLLSIPAEDGSKSEAEEVIEEIEPQPDEDRTE